MTEQEWLSSSDPSAMIRMLRTGDERFNTAPFVVSPRKLRLFACACCRTVFHLLTDEAKCNWCHGKGTEQLDDTTYWSEAPRTVCRKCSGKGRVNRSRRAVEVTCGGIGLVGNDSGTGFESLKPPVSVTG